MRIATTRVGVALSVSAAVAASLAGAAAARIPEGEMDAAARAQPALNFGDFNLGMYLPVDSGLSSIDGWIGEQMTRRVRAHEAKSAEPDAVTRALARRNR